MIHSFLLFPTSQNCQGHSRLSSRTCNLAWFPREWSSCITVSSMSRSFSSRSSSVISNKLRIGTWPFSQFRSLSWSYVSIRFDAIQITVCSFLRALSRLCLGIEWILKNECLTIRNKITNSKDEATSCIIQCAFSLRLGSSIPRSSFFVWPSSHFVVSLTPLSCL